MEAFSNTKAYKRLLYDVLHQTYVFCCGRRWREAFRNPKAILREKWRLLPVGPALKCAGHKCLVIYIFDIFNMMCEVVDFYIWRAASLVTDAHSSS